MSLCIPLSVHAFQIISGLVTDIYINLKLQLGDLSYPNLDQYLRVKIIRNTNVTFNHDNH